MRQPIEARRGRMNARALAGVSIRRATADDLPRLFAAVELFDRPLDRRAARAYLADPVNLVLMAVQGAAVIGWSRGTILRQLDTHRGQFFLYEIAVTARHRRRGVGAALVRETLRWAVDRGCEEAFVFTDDPRNRAAHRLYRSTGGRTETSGDRMYVYALPARPRSPSGRRG